VEAAWRSWFCAASQYLDLPCCYCYPLRSGRTDGLGNPWVTVFREDFLPIDGFGLLAGVAIGVLLSSVYFLTWRMRYTSSIRRDAVLRSRAITAGKIYEQLTPYLPGFLYDPQDVRFLGSPVDLVIFDGLSKGRVRRIVFAEVKTGESGLTLRERGVREIIESGAVEWAELRVGLSFAADPA
jgi:hypothetical protein